MERYRIEDVRIIKLNGRNVKAFTVYEYSEEQGAYIHIGQFSAPVKTANKNLHEHITGRI